MNNPRSKAVAWILAALVAAVWLGGLGATPAQASADSFSQVADFPAGAFLPAVNFCTGQALTYTGNMHVVAHITIDNNGGYHSHSMMNAQGVTATDESGNTYTLSYSSPSHDNDNVGSDQTSVVNMHLTGAGGEGGFSVHSIFHMTVNADGTVTSSFSDVSVDCQ